MRTYTGRHSALTTPVIPEYLARRIRLCAEPDCANVCRPFAPRCPGCSDLRKRTQRAERKARERQETADRAEARLSALKEQSGQVTIAQVRARIRNLERQEERSRARLKRQQEQLRALFAQLESMKAGGK